MANRSFFILLFMIYFLIYSCSKEKCFIISLLNNSKYGEFIMAFDGIVVAGLVHELKQKLTDGRIAKIAQPEAYELLLKIKSPCGQHRLLISKTLLFRLFILQTQINQARSRLLIFVCFLENISVTAGSRIFHSQNWSVSSVLQSNILMSWATFAKRSSLLKSWGNTATSFSVTMKTRFWTVSSMCLPR